eukprot:8942-Heterococcus_DN1.PRE.1
MSAWLAAAAAAATEPAAAAPALCVRAITCCDRLLLRLCTAACRQRGERRTSAPAISSTRAVSRYCPFSAVAAMLQHCAA